MDSFAYGIIGFVVVGVLGLMVWAAQREKPKIDHETETLVFRHSKVFRGFSLFFAFCVPSGLTALVIFVPPKNAKEVWIIVSLYVGFSLLNAPLLWESLRFRLTVSPEGLDCQSPWRKGRFIAWSDVASVSYSKMNSWFIIRATDGWKFRVHFFVAGLQHFLEMCEEYLPVAALRGAKAGYQRIGRAFPKDD